MRKKSLWLALLAILVGAVSFGQSVLDVVLDRTIRSSLLSLSNRFQERLLRDENLHIWFCGTGSPQAEPGRAQSCTAILAEDTFLIFDTGPGSGLRADLDNLPLANLSAVFFTHLHSDHIADLPTFANHSWRYGRNQPLPVYGPSGTAKVVDGFNQALAPDVAVRSTNEVKGASSAEPIGHDVVVTGDDSRVLVYQSKTGLKVYAFLVHHEPVEPAFGYRIEHRGRSVVISGDTRKTNNIAIHGNNADILIHEAYNKDLVNRVLALEKEVPDTPDSRRLFEIARHTQAYHTSPLEAAELAAKGNVRSLILTHIIPPLSDGLKRRVLEPFFLKGIDAVYQGQVRIAEDSMHISLPLLSREKLAQASRKEEKAASK